ncbi:MAG: hypothetical protein E3K36_04825 [Candidatus Brocadia sp.]|nr:hypothetical protein [Candidatus Brocadia sp.]
MKLFFFVSLKTEEGKAIKTRIMLVDTDTSNASLTFNRYSSVLYLPFNLPLELTSEQLRKLSLSFDQTKTALVISKNANKFIINGFVSYGARLSLINKVGQCSAIPEYLIVSNNKPGSVDISFGNFIIGRLEDGKFYESNPGPTASQIYIEYLLEYIKKHQGYKRFGNSYWLSYRDCLTEIYTQTSLLLRGGTIIWLPKSTIDSAEKDIKGGFKFKRSISGIQLLYDLINESDPEIKGIILQNICDHIDLLVQLTGIDGALIIDEELKPLYFGTHLNSNDWQGNIFLGPTKKNPNVEKFDISVSGYGTRHKSAIKFVGNHPGSIAFVASEDGPVRTILNYQNSLYLWPDCTNTSALD